MQMNGTYSLFFYGNATLSFPVSTVLLVSQTYDSATGVSAATLEVPVTTNGQLWIGFHDAVMLEGTPGAKNISLLQPHCSPGETFTAAFLAHIHRFDSLRFMDWASTNDNMIANWVDRRLPSAPSFADTVNVTVGVPWETVGGLPR
jgi:hypothetical protein